MCFALIFGVMTFALPATAGAASLTCPSGTASSNPICKDTWDISKIIKIVVNTLLFGVGSVSVVVIIIGGLRYAISGGNSTAVTNAKNSILYAIIGVVVSICAYAIVNFVILRVK